MFQDKYGNRLSTPECNKEGYDFIRPRDILSIPQLRVDKYVLFFKKYIPELNALISKDASSVIKRAYFEKAFGDVQCVIVSILVVILEVFLFKNGKGLADFFVRDVFGYSVQLEGILELVFIFAVSFLIVGWIYPLLMMNLLRKYLKEIRERNYIE
jgi:hypothetical protein